MFAIIETGGKQYKVNEGEILLIDKIEAQDNETVKFDKVLAVSGDNGFTVGAPYIEGAAVEASVLNHEVKGKKIYVIKYKAKKNEKKKIGHRQCYTKVKITKIGA